MVYQNFIKYVPLDCDTNRTPCRRDNGKRVAMVLALCFASVATSANPCRLHVQYKYCKVEARSHIPLRMTFGPERYTKKFKKITIKKQKQVWSGWWVAAPAISGSCL